MNSERKDWPGLIMVLFSVPSIIVFGRVLVGSYIIPVIVVLLFGFALLRTGVVDVFDRFPLITRFLIVASPLFILLAFIFGRQDIPFKVDVAVIIGFSLLHVVSHAFMKSRFGSAESNDS